jgi:tRNA-modifying protein YgfZ
MWNGNEATEMRDIQFRAGRLPDRAVVGVQGSDSGHFLHNLLTADIEHLEPGAASYAALLSPQGKILFDMMVLRTPEGFLIDCAASRAAGLVQRLGMYKLRAKVEVSLRDDLSVGVSPAEVPGSYRDPRSPDLGWRMIGTPPAEEAEGYGAARIALGLADSEADIGSGEFFPHEANLDQLGGVSFKRAAMSGRRSSLAWSIGARPETASCPWRSMARHRPGAPRSGRARSSWARCSPQPARQHLHCSGWTGWRTPGRR